MVLVYRLPLFPLSNLTGTPGTVAARDGSFGAGDADSIVKDHAFHWLACIETYESNRRVYIDTCYRLIYHDIETCIYAGNCKVIVAFRGTQSGKDLYDDALITLGKTTTRSAEAVHYLQEFIVINPGAYIELTGHSLGGAVAREAGRRMGLKVVTFNSAAPPSAPVIARESDVNYHIVFDVISAWQRPGTVRIDKGYWPITTLLEIPIPYSWIWHVFNGLLDAHSVINFSSLNPGVVVSAATEARYIDQWFSTLPPLTRSSILIFLLGPKALFGSLPSLE